MGKGGGSPESTVVQTDLPEYVQPYFEDLLDRAGTESHREYIPYEGQRISDIAPETLDSFDMYGNIAYNGVPGLYEAQDVVQNTMYGALDEAGNYDPSQFADAGTYLGNTIPQYMSPYMDEVVARQKEGALLDFQRQNAQREADAANAGAFGGSRHGVTDYLAEEGMLDRMQDIEAEGRQRAFETGADLFDRDRQRRLDVERARADENQYAGEFGLRGLEQAYNQAMGYGNMALDSADFDRQSAADLRDIGDYYAAREQAGLDMSYEDFIRQRDYGREQLNYFSSILRGVPVSPSTETTRMLASNPLSQLTGAGLSALGTYNAMQ
jgi:hypothetical protein